MRDAVEKALTLQKKLHAIPEASGCEFETKKTLVAFLQAESDLEIIDCGKWFYAAHREAGAKTGVALRADMDAVMGADAKPYHGCGHDGHASVMAALAASIKGETLSKNLFFLFQHAEETGAGGSECCAIFDRERIDAIYGFHNCPGFPAGSVLMLRDTFACASMGLILSFAGSQSHAAYPENGKNPVFPMAAFFSRWAALTDPKQFSGLTMATPVGLNAGSRSFGVAAGSGEIDLTLRAWVDADLQKLASRVVDTAAALAGEAGIAFHSVQQDVFPATVNAPQLYETLENAAIRAGLPCLTPPEPFRWSEDVGHYGARCPAVFGGIGGGEDAAGLHAPDYQWSEAVTGAALRLFSALIRI